MKRERGKQLPEEFGFRSGQKGTHSSRTMMLTELTALLGERPEPASKDDYRRAIVEENALGKRTASTRRITSKRLAELYALDPKVTVFRQLLVFWKADPAGRPLLALLCAAARDPLLRQTAEAVLTAKPGERVVAAALAEAVAAAFPNRFKPATCGQVARNASQSCRSGARQARRARGVPTARYSAPGAKPQENKRFTPPRAPTADCGGSRQGPRGTPVSLPALPALPQQRLARARGFS